MAMVKTCHDCLHAMTNADGVLWCYEPTGAGPAPGEACDAFEATQAMRADRVWYDGHPGDAVSTFGAAGVSVSRCPCGGTMKPGQALAQTGKGSSDLGGEVVTMSPGGPGRLIACLKCDSCGRSVTEPLA